MGGGKTKADLETEIIFLQSLLLKANDVIGFKSCPSCGTSLRVAPPPDHRHGQASPTTATPPLPPHHDVAPPPDHRHDEASVTTLKKPLASMPSSANTTTSIQDANNGQALEPKKRKRWETTTSRLLDRLENLPSEGLTVTSCTESLIFAIIYGADCNTQTLSMSPVLDPIAAGKRYAAIASASGKRAKEASRLASFQDLIFHSMCAVLESFIQPKQIDEIMCIRSSNSTSKNLKRLRDGAVWANKVISDSTGGEWTDLSSCIAGYFYDCE